VTLTHEPDSHPDGAPIDEPASEQTGAPVPVRRRFDRGLLLASLVIACGATLIVWGMVTALTGEDGIDRPAVIESVSPVENAVQVLQQEGIIVDFEFGWEARLFIDDVELPITPLGQVVVEPGQQLDLPPTAVYDVGNAVLSFQPVEGAVIESFGEGRHEAQVVYWKTVDGPDTARSYSWSFNVI
jgi:hypothetical protein